MGPIGVAKHLVAVPAGPSGRSARRAATTVGAVSAAPWGSASILPISMMYIDMMGGEGLTHATKVAILNANYIAKRLEPHYPGAVQGHERHASRTSASSTRAALKAASGVEVEDIAKRLMDYGFHAPTVSFPVAGTLMIEPTESESKAELDRFCDAMIAIREEIREIESGVLDRKDNPLKNAPHTDGAVVSDTWSHALRSRERAAFPAPWTRDAQVLAGGGARGERVRGRQSRLLVPADGRVCVRRSCELTAVGEAEPSGRFSRDASRGYCSSRSAAS